MHVRWLRFLALSLAGLFSAGKLPAAGEKTYLVSGPIAAFGVNSLALIEGTEKYVIERGPATQATGNFKVGDIVHVEYYMTATGISAKDGAKIGAAGVKTYQIEGTVAAIDANTIALTQGDSSERFVFSRNAGTQTSGSFKPGDIVRVNYYLTATTIGLKAADQSAGPGPRVVPSTPRPIMPPPARAPRSPMAGTPVTPTPLPAAR